MALSERLNTPISTGELDRRWKAVRAAMRAAKIDVLLMQNNNDYMGGYVKYFTDTPATNGYPNTVVFPLDDEMTVVCQGPFGGVETPAGDGKWRGVRQVLTTPSYASAHFTNDYDPELAAKALKPFAAGTIGYVGSYQMSVALLDFIKRAFPKANFVDATELVDKIKVIKSAEEMELVKRAALMQDGAMRAAFAAAKPGMRDVEVAAVAQHYSLCHGSENGIYLCASMPLGEPSRFGNRHVQNRVIREGDQIALLGRGQRAGRHVHRAWALLCRRRQGAAGDEGRAGVLQKRAQVHPRPLKPGTPCKDIWDAFNDFMRKNGRPPESRLYCHGQGYDLVERPLIRNDEPWSIAKDMNIVVHPTYIHGGYLNWLCDNYLIGGNGPGDRLHQFPEEIVEVG